MADDPNLNDDTPLSDDESSGDFDALSDDDSLSDFDSLSDDDDSSNEDDSFSDDDSPTDDSWSSDDALSDDDDSITDDAWSGEDSPSDDDDSSSDDKAWDDDDEWGEETNKNKAGVIIGTIALVLVILGGAYYFLIYQPEQEAKERARLEKIAQEEAERKRKEIEAQNKIRYDALIVGADSVFALNDWEGAQPLYSEASGLFPNEAYPKDQLALILAELDKIAARQAGGEVETISSPTGRFYVIVSSSVDGDLAMDYAKTLAQDGADVKVIEPPADQRVYHRVAVGDYDSWEQATSASTSFTGYENGVWVLKY